MASTFPNIPHNDVVVRIRDTAGTWDDLSVPLSKDYQDIVRAEIWYQQKCVIALACAPEESTVEKKVRLEEDVAYLKVRVLNPLGKNVRFDAAITERNFFNDLDIGEIGEHDIVRRDGCTVSGDRLRIDDLATVLPVVIQAADDSALGDLLGFKNKSKEMTFGISNYPQDSKFEIPVAFVERQIKIKNNADSWRLTDLELEFDGKLSTTCLARPSISWIQASDLSEFSLEFYLSTSRVTKAWNFYPARAYLDALKIVKADSDLSFVPFLDKYKIHAEVALSADVPKEEHEWLALYSFNWKSVSLIDLQPIKNTTATLTFESVITHSGDFLEFDAEIFGEFAVGRELEESRREEAERNDKKKIPYYQNPRIRFGVMPKKLVSTDANIARVGALDLCFAEAFVDQPSDGNYFSIILSNLLPEVDAYLNLPLTDFLPAGQDDVPGASKFNEEFEARKFVKEKPIVIVVDEKSESFEEFHPQQLVDRFLLEVIEKNSSSINRTITLRIKDIRLSGADGSTDNAEPRTVVILDRQPFFVGMVKFQDFYGTDLQGLTTEVGNWNSEAADGAAWELHAGAKEFNLLLPPQAVGEAFEKFGPEKAVLGVVDVEESEAAPFRFSNLFDATLLPTYFKQRYVEPAWNSRRIFGYAGQRAPGAAIAAMSFELLYGLGCTSVSPRMRLAEIMSRVGNFQIPPLSVDEAGYTQSQRDSFDLFKKKNWDRFHATLHRLAVLQPAREDDLETQRIDSNLHFKLRETADFQYPIIGQSPRRENIPNNPDGLAGSYPWAFDSQNDYEELWETPDSDKGEVVGLAFSPLGAWGSQKAIFASGKLTLSSAATMGRTQTFTKERKGRIGCFYNKAKHVVVFERTVKRPAQFPKQDELAGRPVVRKVREYIELLEPIRKYPDSAGSKLAKGCVLKSDFRSKIINVDGEWLQDVGMEGYQIPLWKEVPGLEAIYPKPDIFLEIATDPESGSSSELRAIADPKNLYFYASTTEKTDDTDQWLPVIGVDYSPCIKPFTAPIEYLGEPHVAPGFGRFTFGLERSEKPANFVFDRTDKNLGAVIKNVSMVRHVWDESKGNLSNLFAADDYLENADSLIQTALRDSAPAEEIYNRIQKGYEDLEKKIISSYGKALTELGKIKDVEQLKSTSRNKVSRFFDEKTEIHGREYLKLVAEYIDFIDQLESFVNTIGGITQDKKDFLKEQITKAEESAIDSVVNCSKSVKAVITKLEKLEAVLPILELETLRTTIEGLTPWTASKLDQLQAKINEALDLCEKAISETSRSIEAIFSGWVDTNICSFTLPLNVAVRALRANLSEIINELRDIDLANEARINELRDKAVAEIKIVETALKTVKQKADALLTQLKTYAKTEADNLEAFIKAAAYKIIAAVESAMVLEDLIADSKKILDLLRQGDNLREFEKRITAYATAIQTVVVDKILSFIPSIDDIAKTIGLDSYGALKEAIKKKAPIEVLQKLSSQVKNDLKNELKSLERRILPTLKDEIKASNIPTDVGIKLVRILGETPRVPSLDFRYDTLALPPISAPIAYIFDPELAEVATTAVKAVLDEAEKNVRDSLKPLALSLPTNKMLNQFLPNMENLAKGLASDILKDLSALPFDKLFPSLRIPEPLSEHVIVNHQIDKQTKRANVYAKVAFSAKDPATLFAFGPVAMVINNTDISALISIEADISGSTSKKASGKVSGNWRLNVGGTDFVIFEDTALTFDDKGSLRFNISPTKIRYSGALQFLSDLLKKSGLSDSGSGIRLLLDPLKVICSLEIPIPNVQVAAFAMSNLRLGTSLWVGLKDSSVAIGVAMNLATKMAPFSITICLLGGGGWLEFDAEYVIGKEISVNLSIGITAGACFGINLSAISGAVYVMFGLSVEYHTQDNAGLTIGIMLLISGHVSVLGIIDADITLLLEAKYAADKSIKAHGVLSIRIKICWCFTLKVHKEVTYVLKKGNKSKALAVGVNDYYATAAQTYITSMA